MQIEHHPPAARGVASLMYVGDDQAVENAVAAPSQAEIGVGIAGLALAICGKGTARVVGGAAAAWVALRHLSRGSAR